MHSDSAASLPHCGDMGISNQGEIAASAASTRLHPALLPTANCHSPHPALHLPETAPPTTHRFKQTGLL